MRFQNTLAFFHLNQLIETLTDFPKIDSYYCLTLLSATNCQTCLISHQYTTIIELKSSIEEI
jgi:hypothetical protein